MPNYFLRDSNFLIDIIKITGAAKYIPMLSSINDTPHPNICSSVSTSTQFSNINDVRIGTSASASASQKADAINKVILLESFRKMNKADLYLPGGVHYEDEESTPSFKMSELQKCQDQSKMWAEENLGIKL